MVDTLHLMPLLKDMHIAILVDTEFEQIELTEPKRELDAAGAHTRIVSPHSGRVQGMNHTEKGDEFEVDMTLDEAKPDDFDAVLIPGGAMNVDKLRTHPAAQKFVQEMQDSQKPFAIICHGPWLLISAGIAENRTLTSWPTIQDDIRNAGGIWLDEPVVRDNNWVTSRGPDDLPAFIKGTLALFSEYRAEQIEVGDEIPEGADGMGTQGLKDARVDLI